MARNRLWTFGCSFVQGGGLDGPHYTDKWGNKDWWQEEYITSIWPNYLADLLDFDLVNMGNSGSSIQCAYELLTECLPDIEPGNILVFERTSNGRWPHRTHWYRNSTDRGMGSLIFNPSHPMVEYGLAEDKSKIDKEDWNEWHAKRLDHQISALSNYYFYWVNDKSIRRPDGTYATSNEADYDKYSKLVHRVLDHLELTGVNTYMWDWTLWHTGQTVYEKEGHIDGDGFFESIQAWSREENDDGHWSPNGHNYAAHYFKWCIDNGIRDMERQDKLDYWLNNVAKKLPYIPYNGRTVYNREIGYWAERFKKLI
jgi:hypothetical protein